MRPTPSKKQKSNLLNWYRDHLRPLPWRVSKDPYAIWISETMLQQTTTQAVIPYFEKFLKAFPRLEDLARASEEEVFKMWSGLGYYSRARNLLKAAKLLSQEREFPRTYQELIQYPGLGPYTARAVSSLAFEENVGVLDGNVIRVLSRVHDLDLEWWKTKEKVFLQDLSDQWVNRVSSSQMNQALMELGATICTPKSPSCLLCPLKANCLARKNQTVSLRPKSKPRRKKEYLVWHVKPVVNSTGDKILLNEHFYPVLKTLKMPPGQMISVLKKPETYNFVHCITHYEIFVRIDSVRKSSKALKGEWVLIKDLDRVSPSSLLKKVVQKLETSAHT